MRPGPAAPADMITVATVVLAVLLAVAPARYACSHASSGCCTRYSRMPVPFQLIKGYREQTTMENCHIEAIIFYTVQRKMICATRKDQWVRKLLKLLSSRLRTMSKVSTEGVTQKQLVKPDGSGSFSGAAETFTNGTTGFYQ